MANRRRQLDFYSADEVITEVERLRNLGYARLGKWSLAENCQHLTATMKGGMDGFGFRMPWIMRSTVLKWAFYYTLKKRRMFRGLPTVKQLKPVLQSKEDDPAAIDEFVQTCRRTEAFEGPIENYPLLNDVDVDVWRSFMWIHAAHHLGFLIPHESEVAVKRD